MTPLEHYRRAEELVAVASGEREPAEGSRTMTPLELLAAAAVHARLAGVGTVVSATEPGPTGRPAWMGRPL